MTRTILVVSFTDLKRDPRVNRQIEALRHRYQVIAAGLEDPGLDGVRFVPCRRAPRTFQTKAKEAAELMLRRYETYYWSQQHVVEAMNALAGMKADVVIANDIEALPVSLKIAAGGKVILDAHEYSPRELEDKLAWRLVRQRYVEYLCRTYIGRSDAMMTVADGIAREYKEHFAVDAQVVHNAAAYQELEPSPVVPDRLRMIHHGAALPVRKLENMLEVMQRLDKRFRLDLVLMPIVPSYLESLKRSAAGDDRIRFLPPVPMKELVGFSNAYDIGLYLLHASSFNNLHALPNKFFEFVQSRLMVAIGPSPEMATLVRKHQCGVVAENFKPASLARVLNGLDAEAVIRFKRNSHAAAKELSFEGASRKLLRLVANVLGEG